MRNIVDSALARDIDGRHPDGFIGERLTRIMDTKDTFHVMTSNTLRNRGLIAPVAWFMKCITQKVLADLKASTTMRVFIATGSDNHFTRLVTVYPQRGSTCATLPSPNTSSDDKFEASKAGPRRKSKKSLSNSSYNESRAQTS